MQVLATIMLTFTSAVQIHSHSQLLLIQAVEYWLFLALIVSNVAIKIIFIHLTTLLKVNQAKF